MKLRRDLTDGEAVAVRLALGSQIDVCNSVIEDANNGKTSTSAKHHYQGLLDATIGAWEVILGEKAPEENV